MGIGFSRTSSGVSVIDTESLSDSVTMAATSSSCDDAIAEINNEEFHDTSDELQIRNKAEEMIEFEKQLTLKREQRREVLARHREEKENLKKSLELERNAKQAVLEENKILKGILEEHNILIPNNFESVSENFIDISTAVEEMKEELEKLKDKNNKLRQDLAESNLSLQGANSDIADLKFQNMESSKQIKALREVVTVSKTMINLREQQLNELKEKLTQIEISLADRETNLLSTDLRQEYERQLQNIRALRGLYEERARLAEVTRLNLSRELEEQKRLNLTEANKCKELMTKIEELEEEINKLTETVDYKNDQIRSSQDETQGIKSEMSTVNKLFSQVLLGYKSKQNWDQLVQRLEENHGLLAHMVERDDGSEASSALPKLLLELVSQVDEDEDKSENLQTDYDLAGDGSNISTNDNDAKASQNASAEEIVKNLPKVWKVLMELLSHQNTNETTSAEKITTCYKTVETTSGSMLVPSVSQTYIRLKDLIVEKLALIKEVNKMKQLNVHLESRLGEQERRLCLVTSELSKTWHVVGRLRRHHHQLHTHEKILKYELQQKRKLLNELKEELEYCREKWEKAREKNSQTEKDWRKLRTEFSSRKNKVNSPSFNNSAESGYSDERQSDDSSESNDESEYINEPPKRCKKKLKNSFENILDSSANLAAEREDPISDMLDVADLPLDSQDAEDGANSAQRTDNTSTSESCRSINLKSDKNCDETEDEVTDIGMESCLEENVSENNPKTINTKENKTNNDIKYTENTLQQTDHVTTDIPTSDSVEFLDRIKTTNDRFAKRDKTLDSLERDSSSLIQKTQGIIIRNQQLNSTMDQLLNQPGTSKQSKSVNSAVESDGGHSTPLVIDARQIVENIRKQNERLAAKDQRLRNLEEGYNEVINHITHSLSMGREIDKKLETIHNERCLMSINDNNKHEADIIPITDTANEESMENNKAYVYVTDTGHTLQQTDNVTTSIPTTDSAEFLDRIKITTDRFAKRDKALDSLERDSSSLIQKTQGIITRNEQLNNTMDQLLNQPGTSKVLKGVESCVEKVDTSYTRNLETVENNTADNKTDIDIKYTGNTMQQTNKFTTNIPTSDSPEFLDRIKITTDRFAKRDKALDSLERDSSTLMQKTQSIITRNERLNSTMNQLLNQPGTSKQCKSLDKVVENDEGQSTPPVIGARQILENVKKQNERLAAKDQRLRNLEEGCNEVVDNITNTLNIGKEIEEKLETMHNVRHRVNENKVCCEEPTEIATETVASNSNIEKPDDLNEPSTTSKSDHEARFAARDIRLKLLEEQTKSLVSKVNNTATKRVKIHYKLEELHNIYGSENSRAGTPSGNDDDNNDGNGSNNENNNQDENNNEQ